MGRLKLDWLGQDQRTFLSRGYLSPGETPEDRYQSICDTIQEICDSNSIDKSLPDGDYNTDDIGQRF